MALVGMVALLTAALLLLARIFKLGFLADFLSRTVLVGLLTGVGFQVGIAMLDDMLGVTVHSQRSLPRLWEILQGLPQSNVPTLALSVLVLGSILLGNRIARGGLFRCLRWPDRSLRALLSALPSEGLRLSVRFRADCRRLACPK